MTRRAYLRAAGLAIAALAIVSGLTVYFSTQKIPPCLVTGIPKWHAPQDKALHRFELVAPDRALCFFDMDHDHALAGYVSLKPIVGVVAIAPRPNGRLALRYGRGRGALVDLTTGVVQYGVRPPPAPSDTLNVANLKAPVVYSTRPNHFGFTAFQPVTFRERRITFSGYSWNPRFGPNPPDHGLSFAPDRQELWVLDAPNNVVHVFDASLHPLQPSHVKDIRLTVPLIGKENPCASNRCGRIGSLQHSADGRFVYVGDSGDVIDTGKREEITNLEALHQSRLTLEVDWVDGKPDFPAAR